MSKGLEALKRAKLYVGQVIIRDKEIANSKVLKSLCDLEKDTDVIEEELEEGYKAKKVVETIKKHILSRDMDTSGIYLEFHSGYYEPYYTIEIREGVKQVVSQDEHDLFNEVILERGK